MESHGKFITKQGLQQLLVSCGNSCRKYAARSDELPNNTWHFEVKHWACIPLQAEIAIVTHTAVPGAPAKHTLSYSFPFHCVYECKTDENWPQANLNPKRSGQMLYTSDLSVAVFK